MSPVRGWALLSSAVAPVALVGGWTLGAARQEVPFDPVRETISALAASGAQDAWVMTTGLAVLGGCHVVTALGLTSARPLGRLVLGAGGVAAALVAALPQPSPGHLPAATVSFAALTLWPALSGLPTPRAGLLATGGLAVLLAWLTAQLDGGSLLGLSERVVAAAQALWPLAVVLVLRRQRNGVPTGER